MSMSFGRTNSKQRVPPPPRHLLSYYRCNLPHLARHAFSNCVKSITGKLSKNKNSLFINIQEFAFPSHATFLHLGYICCFLSDVFVYFSLPRSSICIKRGAETNPIKYSTTQMWTEATLGHYRASRKFSYYCSPPQKQKHAVYIEGETNLLLICYNKHRRIRNILKTVVYDIKQSASM
jgi:hypothetical protein